LQVNVPAGQVDAGSVQTPFTQLWTAPQIAQDAPHAPRFDEWSEHASSVPSARWHWNWPAGHVAGVVQTPLMQLCVAPQIAHEAPHAVRFDAWSEQASPVPSGRLQANVPAGQVDAGSVQTPFTQLWAAPQVVQDAPQVVRLDECVEQASSEPLGCWHWNWPAGHVAGVVQTPSMQLCAAPQIAHDGPQAPRLDECVEQASSVPSTRRHWNSPVAQPLATPV
jgi:hypothetical protein